MQRIERYVVEGKPIPLARPRLFKSRVYNPRKKLLDEFSLLLQCQRTPEPLFSGAVELEIVFYMPIPKSLSKKKQNALYAKFHEK